MKKLAMTIAAICIVAIGGGRSYAVDATVGMSASPADYSAALFVSNGATSIAIYGKLVGTTYAGLDSFTAGPIEACAGTITIVSGTKILVRHDVTPTVHPQVDKKCILSETICEAVPTAVDVVRCSVHLSDEDLLDQIEPTGLESFALDLATKADGPYVKQKDLLANGVDADEDGVPDKHDNCNDVANYDLADSDGDGVGDACDVNDSDGDGLPDDIDQCPSEAGGGTADGCPVQTTDQTDTDDQTTTTGQVAPFNLDAGEGCAFVGTASANPLVFLLIAVALLPLVRNRRR